MTDDEPYTVTCRCCEKTVNEFDICYNTSRGNLCKDCEAALSEYREMMRNIET